MTIPTFGIEKPTAAKLNALKAAFVSAHTLLGDTASETATPYEYGESVAWYFFHTHRYLHFGSVGTLQDISNTFPEVDLSEDDTGYGILDLDTISWLAYGQMYKVIDVSFCREDENP